MSDEAKAKDSWVSIRDFLSQKRFAILGGRTLAENAAYWEKRCGPPLKPYEPAEPKAPEADLPLHLERSGVPERLAKLLASLRPTEGVAAVKAFAKNGKRFLVLSGDPGVGKTVAAASLLLFATKHIAWDGGSDTQWDSVSSVFVKADELARYSYFDREEREYLRHISDANWLVLDDLGAEVISSPWQAALEALIDSRHGRLTGKCIITTNLSTNRESATRPSQFEVRYGSRMARRLRESGEVVVLSSAEEA